MNAALFSSADQRWNTPRWFIDLVEGAFGPIGLDPCSNADSVVRAAREYRFEDRGEDGLILPWEGFGLVYVNPPFGREIPEWARRWSAHRGELVALVPARTDTAWWQGAAKVAAEGLLWRGRLAYRLREKSAGNAPFPSSVLYYGPRPDIFRRTFGPYGILLKGEIPELAPTGRAPGSARELKRIRARLAHAASSLEAIQSDDYSSELAAALRSVNDRLERYDREIQERAVPQRARKTRNGSAAEWAAVRASVRGISLDQVTLGGGTVADVVVAPMLAERGISRARGS